MFRKVFTVSLVAALALVAPACKNAKVGARCSAKEGAARNATHVLFCVGGKWKATVTIGQAAEIVMSTWPASVEPYASGSFTVAAGAAIPVPTLFVKDKGGRLVAGTEVRLSAPGLFAGTDVVTLTSDANGVVRPMLSGARIGSRPGTYTVSISAGPLRNALATWTVRVKGGQPASVAVVSGGGQTISAGGSFAPWVFEVRDAAGAPADTTGWTLGVSTGWGSPGIGALAVSTDNGRITVEAPAQTTARTGRIYVRYERPTPWGATESAEGSAEWTVQPGALDDALVDGDDQVAPVNTRYQQILQVLPVDQFGNGIAGIPVTFEAIAGAGGASATLTTFAGTGPNASWAYVDANGTAGEFTVRATVPGLGSYDFALTNTPPVG